MTEYLSTKDKVLCKLIRCNTTHHSSTRNCTSYLQFHYNHYILAFQVMNPSIV